MPWRKKGLVNKMLVLGILFYFIGASATLVCAKSPWEDSFDSYSTGQFLDGGSDDGGWKGWGNNPAAGATVTDIQYRSAPHSVDINGASNLVHEYHGCTEGSWMFKTWQYIPNEYAGISYFSLLSSYDDAGEINIWNVQLWFDSNQGLVGSDFDGNIAPLIKGVWNKIVCIIDLDSDWLQIYYNGVLLVEHAWTDTVQGTGGGLLNIAAVDLFANNASSIYYDGMSHLPPGPYLLCDAGGPYTDEINKDILFTGFAVGGIEPYIWAWDFGDGATASIQNPTHAYIIPGIYTVTLTVTDDELETFTDTTTATIIASQPVLEIGSIIGGLGIKSSLKNTGYGAATNVEWTITLDGKLVFVGKSSDGTFMTIAAEGEETIKTGFILGFSKINIVITAKAQNALEVSATKSALLLGPFVVRIK
jgi:hypothetical protein